MAAAAALVAVALGAAALISPLVGPAAAATGAAASESQGPDLSATVILAKQREWAGLISLLPQRNVVAVLLHRGPLDPGRGGRGESVQYAVRTAPGALGGGRFRVRIGRVGTIAGRIVEHAEADPEGCPEPGKAFIGGRFVGALRLRADGHSTIRYGRAPVRTTCRSAFGEDDGKASSLFGYVQSYAGSYFNHETPALVSEAVGRRRITLFTALSLLNGESATFKAGSYEWLPGEVATSRATQVARVPGRLFALGKSPLLPRTATVNPPAPFSGEATYTRKRHRLVGDLRVRLPGLELPLTGGPERAEICDPNHLGRPCDR